MRSARIVRERSAIATWTCSWPKSMPSTRPAERSSVSSVGGRPCCGARPSASDSDPARPSCSTTSPCDCRSETSVETVERDSPVMRARSARLALPRRRSASSSWRRLRSLSDSSEPDPTGDIGRYCAEPDNVLSRVRQNFCPNGREFVQVSAVIAVSIGGSLAGVSPTPGHRRPPAHTPLGYNYSGLTNRGDPPEAMRMQTTTTTTDPTSSAAAPPDGTDTPPRTPVRNFVRHYAEMLVAMFLGMFVLGFALTALLELAGVDVGELGHRDTGAVPAWDGVHDDRPDGRLDALPRAPPAAVLGDGRGDVRADVRRDRRAVGRRPAARATAR